ncbi:MAG: DUF4321 domain-containing protein [Clostridium sp.]|nr:DUF4321 domain-containing protein [Acetatifactor muris]MCM1526498.1 DUF4321 domain-containing protein [Bacteroides sp.]MCM1562376.1 DUF4321 domain-containing protein [Clostridium sp.]
MRKANWLLIWLVLIGFVLGTVIAQIFPSSFLNYGQVFGLSNPIELDMGFIILTFGLRFNITIAGIIGVVIAFVVYRFIR